MLYLIPTIENIDDLLELLKTAVNEFIENGISSDELKAAINGYKIHFERSFDNLTIAGMLWLNDFLVYYEPEHFPNILKNLEEDVSAEKIIDFLKKYILNINPNLIILTPCNDENRQIWLQEKENKMIQEKKLLERFKRITTVEKTTEIIHPINFDSFKLQMLKPDESINTCGLEVLILKKLNESSVFGYLNFKDSAYALNSKEFLIFDLATQMLFDVNSEFTREEYINWSGKFGSSIFIHKSGFHLVSPSQNFTEMLKKFFELIKKPVFNQKELDKIKELSLSRLITIEANPVAIAQRTLFSYFQQNSTINYTFHEAKEIIQGATIEDLNNIYFKFMNPFLLKMIVGGNFDQKELVEILTSNLSNNFNETREELIENKLTNIESNELIEINLPCLQENILFGKILPINFEHKDYASLLLLQQIIFGAGIASKIMELRMESGLFYGCSGNFFNYLAGIKNQVLATISVTVAPGKGSLVLEKIKNFMSNLIQTGFTQTEMDSAKKNIFTQQNSIKDFFQMGLMTALNDYLITGDSFNDEKAWEKIKKVTLAELNEELKKYLNLDSFVCVHVGNNITK